MVKKYKKKKSLKNRNNTKLGVEKDRDWVISHFSFYRKNKDGRIIYRCKFCRTAMVCLTPEGQFFTKKGHLNSCILVQSQKNKVAMKQFKRLKFSENPTTFTVGEFVLKAQAMEMQKKKEEEEKKKAEEKEKKEQMERYQQQLRELFRERIEREKRERGEYEDEDLEDNLMGESKSFM